MIRTAGGVLAGARAALAVPRWLEGPHMARLLQPSSHVLPGAAPPRGAIRSAMTLVQLLARVPGSPWRNTCLYRSVAECLVLRRYGVSARLCIGVRSEGAEGGAISAHAWVERADGRPAASTRGAEAHQPLVLRA
jgi:hypothetical protein